MSLAWENLVYLLASVLFIWGIKGMTHPRTAVRGNLVSALAMLIAIVVTLLAARVNYWIVASGLLAGTLIGAVLASRIRMTGMPQMVALLNGFGGGASTLVGWAVAIHVSPATDLQTLIATAASGLIGAVTFWGSLVAFAKLEELPILKNNFRIPRHQLFNALLFLLCLGLAVLLVRFPNFSGAWYFLLVVLASVLGVTLVTPIGGADMPVVISLLNSYSGLAGAATGFVINNNMLVIAGSLVGASGIILSMIMCRAMNRSLANVIFGGIDISSLTTTADDIYAGKIKSSSAEDVAIFLADARKVAIVPGYGMAVSQAQYAVRDLYRLLQDKGTDVFFAIHPVAGRMPGHMNVLLAEVDIPYEKLKEMDEANTMFEQTDVAIVIGANDVVNPDARQNPNSPIAGMPILDVDKAHTVVVIKRSLSPGFAGIPNPLFAADNTLMYFADGKKAVLDLVAAIKDL